MESPWVRVTASGRMSGTMPEDRINSDEMLAISSVRTLSFSICHGEMWLCCVLQINMLAEVGRTSSKALSSCSNAIAAAAPVGAAAATGWSLFSPLPSPVTSAVSFAVAALAAAALVPSTTLSLGIWAR